MVYLALVSYIGAAMTVCSVYDSGYLLYKKKRSVLSVAEIQLDECEYLMNHKPNFSKKKPTSTSETMPRSCIEKVLDQIYQWDNNFRFTTIALSTYMVAFILLLYLPVTFIVLYTTLITKSMSFFIYFFQPTLKMSTLIQFYLINFKVFLFLDLEKWPFKTEIILSAIITMTGLGIQLLRIVNNYKKHKKELHKGKCDDIPSADKLGAKTIIAQSSLYPGYFIQYVVGSLVIVFHLLLFIIIILRILWAQPVVLNMIFIFLLPLGICYAFQWLIGRYAGIFVTSDHSENATNSINMPVYTNSMYFTFIPSKSFL
jgi:hypothetical protein